MIKSNINLLLIALLLAVSLSGDNRSVPEWSVDITNYEFNANVVAKIFVNNEQQNDMSGILAAFYGTECRGVTLPTQFGNDALFFLTVYANQPDLQLNFSYYQAESDMVLNIDEEIVFQPNQLYGSVLEPLQMNIFIDYDNPPIVADIPNQIVNFTENFNSIELNNYLTELDGDEIVWNAQSGAFLQVLITDNLALIEKTDPLWSGSESVIFTATDQTSNSFSASDTVQFTVLPTDHPPQLNDIPNQSIPSGHSFTEINLNDYLVEIDNDSISWEYQFMDSSDPQPVPEWTASPSGYELTMSLTLEIISEGSYIQGAEHILAAFCDNECRGISSGQFTMDKWLYFLTIFANTSGEEISFRLYDSDKEKELPVFETVTFSANGIIGNPLEPFILNSGNFLIEIDQSNIVDIFIVDNNWYGSETIGFTAVDINTNAGYSDSDTATFTVLQDHAPQILPINDQTISLGEEFESISLDDYLIELDGDDVIWSHSNVGNLNVNIVDNVAEITVVSSEWTGTETLTFTATDVTDFAASGSVDVNFTVLGIDNPPIVVEIPDQVIASGMQFEEIPLNDFLMELDGDEIGWSFCFPPEQIAEEIPDWQYNPNDFEFSMNLTAEITAEGSPAAGDSHTLYAVCENECRGMANAVFSIDKWLYFLTIHSNIIEEEISFEFYDTAKGRLMPVLQKIGFVNNLILGSPLQPVQFDAGRLILDINSAAIAEINITDNWSGECILQFFAEDLYTTNGFSGSDEISLTVIDDNAPRISPIADQTIFLNESFADIDLDDYLIEIDGDPVLWSWYGNEFMQLNLNTDNILNVSPISNEWSGSETITFRVQDNTPFAAWNEQAVTYTILPEDLPPEVTDIPDQSVNIDHDFMPVELSQYLIELDGDEVVWSYEFLANGQTIETPNWEIDPNDYQYTMNLTAEVYSKGCSATGEQHLLAAFSDNECRGITTAMYNIDHWLYFLTIYSNSDEDEISFKFYDQNFQQILPIQELVSFTSNQILGTPLEPFQFSAGFLEIDIIENIASINILDEFWTGSESVSFTVTDAETINQLSDSDEVIFTINSSSGLTVSKEFTSGWNWFSINVVSDDMSINSVLSSIYGSGSYIKNQTQFANYSPEFGWFGSMNSISNTNLYRLEMNNPDTLNIEGIPVDVENLIYNLNAGWNWISYAPQTVLEINEALSALEDNAIYIKDQIQFSSYCPETGWFGSLSELKPLNGYLLDVITPGEFTYPGNVRNGSFSSAEKEYNNGFDPHQFHYNASLLISSYQELPEKSLISAFCNNELRSTCELLDYENILGKKYYAIMLYSNTEFEEDFQLYYQNNQSSKLQKLDLSFNFTADTHTGSFEKPVIIDLNSYFQDDPVAQQPILSAYPNPFNPSTKISYVIAEKENVNISIYNLKGQRVTSLVNQLKDQGTYNINWDASEIPSGLYFLKLQTESFHKNFKLVLIK